MAKERLSKLQRAILTVMHETGLKSYTEIKMKVADKLGVGIEKRKPGYNIGGIWCKGYIDFLDDSFEPSFSRSIRNLCDKGLIEPFCWRGNYISSMMLTHKGLDLILNVKSSKS